jgi:phenylacetyl-CoA:acceptor oxidoreductase 26-kDa subunit
MRQTAAARPQNYWDLRAAGNFIAGGAGSGLIAVSGVAAATSGTGAGALTMAIGAAGVALGLFFVWLEIGKPWRSLNVFLHPQTSWMTREAIVAMPLLLTAAGGAWFALLPLMILAAMLALVFLYCQARILRASKGIPAWRQAEIVPLIFASGLAEGSGLYLAAAGPTTWVTAIALAACFYREGAWLAYLKGLALTAAAAPVFAVISSPGMKMLRLFQVTALGGLFLTAALGAGTGIALSGLLAAVTGWGIKAILITRAAYTRSATISFTPVRGRGPSRYVA